MDGIPPKTFDLAELHIQDSGLGLFNSADTSKTVFLASFVECVSVLEGDLSLEEPDINTGMVHEASRCLQFFHSLDPTITQDSLTKMATKTAESRITLQHQLAQILRGSQRDRVMSQFQEPREIAWLESLQDSTAGLWLDCAPKSDMHKIANDEFRDLLRGCAGL